MSIILHNLTVLHLTFYGFVDLKNEQSQTKNVVI